jgi:hypothetical protein
MLREARIVMPYIVMLTADRKEVWEPKSLDAHRVLKERICAAFGGFTMTTGHGGWVDVRGIVHKDTVAVYDIAVDSDRDAPFELIARFAIEAGKALSQESVYVRYPNGEVDIIELPAVDKVEEKRNDMADAMAMMFAQPERTPDQQKADRLLDALVQQAVERGAIVSLDLERFADVGDGRAVIHEPDRELPQPGQLWQQRSGKHAWVGRRCTIYGGGWYVTELHSGFEYVVDLEGRLQPHIEGGSLRDLVKHLH